MKLLFTEGIGASQTTTNAQDEKIPVYETKTAAENDLANLEVGQIIATKDEGNELSNPVDVVQDGNMHAITSNAVADAISNILPVDVVQDGNMRAITSNAVADAISNMHPTIDISKVFSNGSLKIFTLYDTYGEGRYILLGQGSNGNSTSTIDIWTLASGTIACIVSTSYSSNTLDVASLMVGITGSNITINNGYASKANYIVKVCSFA